MSIRLLAKDLYRLQGEVEKLERALAAAAAEECGPLSERLRQTRAERDHLRGVLDGQKDAPASPKPGRP